MFQQVKRVIPILQKDWMRTVNDDLFSYRKQKRTRPPRKAMRVVDRPERGGPNKLNKIMGGTRQDEGSLLLLWLDEGVDKTYRL